MILAFDTSAARCAAALLSGGAPIATEIEEMERGQTEALFPLLRRLLDASGADWSDLKAIAVGTGPGNFTGIRIAVAAARGLSMSLNISAIGVTGFEALAEAEPRPVLATIPGPRDQVFVQEMGPDATSAARLVSRAKAADIAAAKGLPVLGSMAKPPVTMPDPVAIGRCAERRLGQPDHIERPSPFYVRSADAAPSRDIIPPILP